MPQEIRYEHGYCRFARDAHDKMGFEGMAEIYLCLACQFPKDSRQDPPWEVIRKISKHLMKKYEMSLSQIEYAFKEENYNDKI